MSPASADEEDDYMDMVIPEPKSKKPETSAQRRLRKQRENEDRNRPKTAQEREAEKEAAKEAVYATAIDRSNKGFKMMAKLGFKPGDALGRSENARKDPIQAVPKDDRGGIGMESEKKRKIREATESESKRAKAEEGDYRERMRVEREEKRNQGMLTGAQKVAEKLDLEFGTGMSEGTDDSRETPLSSESKPLKAINVLYRALERKRREQNRDERLRTELHNSLSAFQRHDDPEEDDDDRHALGPEPKPSLLAEDEDDEDAELADFESSPTAERLDKVVLYLRDTYHYCFWCKYKYDDQTMDGCPGTTEDDHN